MGNINCIYPLLPLSFPPLSAFIKKHTMRIVIILLLIPIINYGQVAINSTASTADPSAMLDVSSSTLGVLIPRMTTADRDMIADPATGLMIFNSATNSFNYWSGTAWMEMNAGNTRLLADNDGDTKVEVEKNVRDCVQAGNHSLEQVIKEVLRRMSR